MKCEILNKKYGIEFKFHFCIWLGAVLYSLYNVYIFTNSEYKFSRIYKEDLVDGWSLLGRLKDVSDYEWNTWRRFGMSLLPWLCIHFCGAELCRMIKCNLLEYWYSSITFAFLLYKFGIFNTLIFFIQPCIFYFICKQSTTNKKTIWITSCVILALMNMIKKAYESSGYIENNTAYDNDYMVMITVSWIHLRCLSYALEITDHQKNKKSTGSTVNLLALLSYTFYLPLLFMGPIILYDDFKKSLSEHIQGSIGRRLYCFVYNFTRYVGWLFFTDLCLHFIYFNAHLFNIPAIRLMSNWSLFGGGFWMGLYFYLKYLVVYGLTGTWVALDHIQPEIPPRCIARIHRYSQMWKYFDVGLHKFLLRYIYKPIMDEMIEQNTTTLMLLRALASLLCFTFVFFWHGAHDFIFVWTVLNYVGIVIENIGTTVSKCDSFQRFRSMFLTTDTTNDRFNAFAATPVLIVSALSNFYFFAGYAVGNVFVERVWNQSMLSFIIMFVCLYSSCRASQYLCNVGARNIMT